VDVYSLSPMPRPSSERLLRGPSPVGPDFSQAADVAERVHIVSENGSSRAGPTRVSRVCGRTPKKERGCIAASPNLPLHLFSVEAAYLFFFALAFFFAGILFSSQLLQNFRQQSWRSAYSTSCIVIALALVKRKVNHAECFFRIPLVRHAYERQFLHFLGQRDFRSVP
jgi:hypothetical protein